MVAYNGDVRGYLTLKDAARRYGYADEGRALRSALQHGRVAGEKVGNTWLVEEASLRAYVARTNGRAGRPRTPKAEQP